MTYAGEAIQNNVTELDTRRRFIAFPIPNIQLSALLRALLTPLLVVGGLASFCIAAFLVHSAVGFAVIGAACFILEYLTRTDS